MVCRYLPTLLSKKRSLRYPLCLPIQSLRIRSHNLLQNWKKRILPLLPIPRWKSKPLLFLPIPLQRIRIKLLLLLLLLLFLLLLIILFRRTSTCTPPLCGTSSKATTRPASLPARFPLLPPPPSPFLPPKLPLLSLPPRNPVLLWPTALRPLSIRPLRLPTLPVRPQ